MNTGKTLFAQLMDFLPWKTFYRITDHHDGDRYVKSMTCSDQFRVLAFAQLTYRESLRDIEAVSYTHLDVYKRQLLDNTRPFDLRVRYLLEMNMPFVTFGRTEFLTEHPFVDADNEKAALDATRHLARLGHRRIALIGPPLMFTYALQRRRGYLTALELDGLSADTVLISDEGVSARRNREVVKRMLAMPDPPTGFVSTNDSTTLGVMAGLRDAGRIVGRDCDIVSRDFSEFSGYLNPPLSTCHLDIQKVAATMSEFILKRIDGAPVIELQRVFECDFVKR